MKFAFLLGIILLLFSCSRINVASRDYYHQKHMRHGVVPLSSGLVKRLDEASVARGKVLYTKNCFSCHGPNGQGDGPLANQQSVRPSDLKKLVSEVPDFEFYMSVSQWQGDMPGWKEEFNSVDKNDLESYIKTFK